MASLNVKLACSWVYAPALASEFDHGSTGLVSVGKKHIINLYHDGYTGVRIASLDFVEIPNSSGVSTVMMESRGHKIDFFVEGRKSSLEINKRGITSFSYRCIVDNAIIPESSRHVLPQDARAFHAVITDVIFLPDEDGKQHIAWYTIQATRLRDKTSTTVAR